MANIDDDNDSDTPNYMKVIFEAISEYKTFDATKIKYFCELCGKTFINKTTYGSHINKGDKHDSVNIDNINSLTCKYCLIQKHDKPALKRHLLKCDKEIGEKFIKNYVKICIHKSILLNKFALVQKSKNLINPFDTPCVTALRNEDVILKLVENKDSFIHDLICSIWFNDLIPQNKSFKKMIGIKVQTYTGDKWDELEITEIVEKTVPIIYNVATELLEMIGYDDTLLTKRLTKFRDKPDDTIYYMIFDNYNKRIVTRDRC